LKQYPEGKWTEEARIRVENFTLAAAPSTPAQPGAETPPPEAAAPPAAPKSAPSPTPSKPAAAKTPAASSARAATKPRGSYGVQLGAFKSGADAANKRWARLDKQYPQLLSGLSSKVSPKKGTSGTLYRLQVAGLTEKRANAICKTLKAQRQACVLIQT
jgi:D-alanyl-D-alanine carboxypeptidase (penicillin-binding protein 5/6)